jgi:putative hydrolase of HD superfamily
MIPEDLIGCLEFIKQAEKLKDVIRSPHTKVSSIEAQIAKGLDKLETIIQHNHGKNPSDFDYEFNLSYGQSLMDNHPLFSQIGEILDVETKKRAQAK